MANSPAPGVRDSLEITPCLLCGSRDYHSVFEVQDRLGSPLHPDSAGYWLVACSVCGFRFLNPRPAAQDLGKYYKGGSYSPHQNKGGGAVGIIYRLLRPFSVGFKARQATRGLGKGAVLDVGCGTGKFLAEMRRRGWDGWGIEKDEAAAQMARESGRPVLVGDPLDVDLENHVFDLITLWHSLEHLPDPKGALVKLVQRLKPTGRLVIALPNPDSLDARYYGSRWAGWDAPRHLYHFRPDELERLLGSVANDFRLIKTASLPLDPFYHALLSEISWSRGLVAYIRSIRAGMIGLGSFMAGFSAQRGSSIMYLFEKS